MQNPNVTWDALIQSKNLKDVLTFLRKFWGKLFLFLSNIDLYKQWLLQNGLFAMIWLVQLQYQY